MFSKMQRKGASLEQVYDVRALRIIVKRKEDCYAALREVERLWTPVEGRFKVRKELSLSTVSVCAVLLA